MLIIYNKKTGKEKTLDPVDAREHVNTGNWSYHEDENLDQSDEASAADVAQLRDEMFKLRAGLEASEEARKKAVKDLGDVESEFEKSESELSRARNTIVRLEKELAEATKAPAPTPKAPAAK